MKIMNLNERQNFFQLLAVFFAPLASVVLMVFGSAFFTTFVSVYLDSVGYTSTEIGWIHSANFFGLFLGAFQMESLIKRVGHIQALAVFGSLATCAILLLSVYQTFFAWFVLRFLVGVSLAALYIVIESWLLWHSNIKTRGLLLSVYMICLTLSLSLSQQVLAFVDIHSFTPFIVSAVFTSLSVIPVGLSTNRISLPPLRDPLSYVYIAKASPFGVLGCLVTGLLISVIYSFYPLFSLSRGIPSENLMTITIAGGVLLQWPIGKLTEFLDRRKTLLGMVVITLFLSLLGFFYKGESALVIFMISFFFGGVVLYDLSSKYRLGL